MGSSAPHPAAETGKTREEHIELSRTGQGLSFTGSFLPSAPASSAQGRPHCCGQPSAGHILARLSLSLPLPAHFLTPTIPCSRLGYCCCHGRQTRGGHKAKMEEATLCSQRALSGLRRGQGMDIWRASAWGTGFLDHCVCPMRPTHRALLSPGSPGKRGGVKNGLRTFKKRYNLQIFQHINMMCLHSDEGQETILALGAKNNLLLWRDSAGRKYPKNAGAHTTWSRGQLVI